ncbi:helicase-like transcription factor CHR28 isoform X2 [Phragmites australis]|uniref:helicase-like transcription factor CHR28 isoform X2 n=1 Tax=Phragmites australis TaxID=29695 RepID=UPI002D772069|nr:helicase-like transcription factor CHR28 isoform X2 [Phragmites australis]
MFASSMDIIDVSSDSEDIIDLCSDSEDNIDLHSDREDDLGCEDPDNSFHQLRVSPITTSDQNSVQPPISLEDYDWLSCIQASSSHRPAENRSTTEMSKVPFAPVNHGSFMGMPHDSAHAIPIGQWIDNVGTLHVSDDNKKTLPLSLTNGTAAKSEHFYASNDAHQFPQSFTQGSSRIFSENRILHQSIEPNHSSLGDNRIKEELTVKSNGFQRCLANGNGMSSSTMPTDDVYVYGGPRSHRIFPPPMPSMASVNDAEVANDVEKRLFGFNEKVVYEEALQHISQEKKEEDLPEGVMSVSLLKHQKIALAWMISKENSSHCPGGILADDQGLGKTISTIALIQKERVQQSRFMADFYRTKSVLSVDDDDDVVVVMDKKELKDEPQNKLDNSTPLHVATGLKSCASRSRAAADSIVETIEVEPKKKTRVRSTASTLKSNTRAAAGTLVVCPASVLKQWANELSVKVMESAKLSVLVYHGGSRTRDPTELATYDVVVTTYTTVAHEVPKENSDDEQKNNEMYGICPEFCVGSKRKQPPLEQSKAKENKPNGGPLARVRWFRVVLDEAQTIKNYRTQVARACCGLSAERRWCLSGTPIQNKIDDLYSYFCFLKYEPYSEFSSFSDMIKNPISKDPVRGYKKLQAILRIVLLRRTKETLIDGEPIIKLPPKTIQLSKIDFTQDERAFYLTLEEGSRQKFKAYDAAGTIKENYANILVLLLRLRQACDHPLLLKGQKSDLIDNGSVERAKQLPKETVTNLLEKLERDSAICSICSDPPEDAVVATCGHVFCYQCVYGSLISDENVCPSPLCRKEISAQSVFSPAALNLCILSKLESDATTSCSTAADKLSSICESSYISSKIRAAVDILNSIINTCTLTGGDTTESVPGETAPVKAIVFTQWTGMLDLLELSLKSNHIEFRRLDGSMSLNIRESAVTEFKTDPEVRVMIMSLKAGNLGLNMIAACHVIMLDPWWNPYAEDQAVDRAHRIGQTRPVNVSRLTIKDTVEDRILALQENKRKMVQSVFGEDKSSGNATRLTVEDLRYLFMV